MPLILVYILTAVISIGFAFLLTQLARSSAKAKMDADNKIIDGLAQGREYASLGESIFKEINEATGSSKQSQEISSRLLNVISKEVDERIGRNNQEISDKYESVIKEKAKNEELAWKKYKNTLTDKKRTEAVIRSIAEGLVVVDSQGKVVMLNPAAEKLLGISQRDKVGKGITENIKKEGLISLIKEPANKEEREIEIISQQDETKKILRASSAVIENESGETVGMVSMLSDITKQKELDRMKESFVASVSHELRTPLVAIDKSISLFLQEGAGAINESQKQLLDIAERNLKRLTLMVNDLLDLSKLEAGKMELKVQGASIDKTITESVESLRTWAKTKSINIEIKIQQGLPEVSIDANKIIQVLNNLIGNAIKFTPSGGSIFVAANLNNAANAIEVSVSDTGIGISPEEMPKIFDKFYQVSERAPTDINGTGIGLSIAKEIVQLHGGKIWAESEKNSGAKFAFTLPLLK